MLKGGAYSIESCSCIKIWRKDSFFKKKIPIAKDLFSWQMGDGLLLPRMQDVELLQVVFGLHLLCL